MKRVKDLIYMISWQAANYLVPLITFPYLARVLGPEGYGALGLAIVLVGYATVMIDWGFNVAGTKAVALANGDPHLIGQVVSEILFARALLAVVAMTILIGVVFVFGNLREGWGIIIYSLVFPLGAAISLSWCLQGMLQFGYFAAASVAARILSIPMFFIFVDSPDDIGLAVLIQGAPALVSAAISLALIHFQFGIRLKRVSTQAVWKRIQQSASIFAGNLSHSIYTGSGVVALGLLSSPVQLGLFAASDRIRVVSQGVIAPISQALFPRASQLFDQSPKLARKMLVTTLVLQGALTTFLSIFLYIFAEKIIGILVGSAFNGAAHILRLISIMPVLVGTNNVLSVQGLLARGLNNIYARATGCVAIVNIAVTVFAATTFGAEGVACAIVGTEIFLSIILFYLNFLSINYSWGRR